MSHVPCKVGSADGRAGSMLNGKVLLHVLSKNSQATKLASMSMLPQAPGQSWPPPMTLYSSSRGHAVSLDHAVTSTSLPSVASVLGSSSVPSLTNPNRSTKKSMVSGMLGYAPQPSWLVGSPS